jgi:hypothetical protein
MTTEPRDDYFKIGSTRFDADFFESRGGCTYTVESESSRKHRKYDF